jgi:hypothetical protein
VSVLLNAEFVKYEDMVPCISHHKKTHGESEVVVDAKKKTTRKSCEKYPSIPCEVHDAFGGTGLQTSYTPASFICGPDGAPLQKPDDQKGWDRSVGSLTKKLQEIQQKLGKPYPRAQYDKAVKDLSDADEDIAAGKFEKAVKAVVKLSEDKKIPAAMHDGRIKQKLDALEAKGGELLEEAKGKKDSAKEDALKLAKQVAKDFKGLECAKAAAELVKELEGK